MPGKGSSGPRTSLRSAIESLMRLYPAGEVLRDPMALILWENIGYLIDDTRRAQLFAELKSRVGLSPQAIARAPEAVLSEIAERGGMRPETRVERLRRIAQLVLEEADGDLAAALRNLAPAKARSLLKKFPTIGDPGADKILLFSGTAVQACVDSNGLRVLVRLGYCAQGASYASTYKAAVSALAAQGICERDWLVSAYSALRAHGQALCKRSGPLCVACPLDAVCLHVKANGL